MNLATRIKELANSRNITIAELERNTGISNGQIRKWDIRSPKAENLQKVADYFDVSTDYLLGRTDKKHYYELTEKDQRGIDKELEDMMNGLDSKHSLSFFQNGQELSDEDKELLRVSMRQTLELSKQLAKRKFTPKKYRHGEE